MPRLKSLCDCVRLTDLPSSCVDQVGALGHLSDHLIVKEVLCTLHMPTSQNQPCLLSIDIRPFLAY